MDPRQIALVRNSFASIGTRAQATGIAFYKHLFQINPACRAMFSPDVGDQARKLMQMLEVIVDGLDQPEPTRTIFRSLGRRHAYYGVDETHYDDAGAALLQALRASMPDQFDTDVEDAWASIYAELAETMIAAARSQRVEYPAVNEAQYSVTSHAVPDNASQIWKQFPN